MHEDDRAEVLQLAVLPSQIAFVGFIDEVLKALEPTEDAHVIAADNCVVGFFLLDHAYHLNYAFAQPDELGFRCYFIDYRQQGKGYGKASLSLLPSYLREHYRDYSAVVLTVNCRNAAAIQLYRTGGFQDTGQLYHGGSAGPQHIMHLSLTK